MGTVQQTSVASERFYRSDLDRGHTCKLLRILKKRFKKPTVDSIYCLENNIFHGGARPGPRVRDRSAQSGSPSRPASDADPRPGAGARIRDGNRRPPASSAATRELPRPAPRGERSAAAGRPAAEAKHVRAALRRLRAELPDRPERARPDRGELAVDPGPGERGVSPRPERPDPVRSRPGPRAASWRRPDLDSDAQVSVSLR